MARKERRPEAKNLVVPVFAPSSNGVTQLELAKASMRHGVLMVEFNNKVPAIAIQNMFERGVVLGLSFIMIKNDETNEAMQEQLARENMVSEISEALDALDPDTKKQWESELGIEHDYIAEFVEATPDLFKDGVFSLNEAWDAYEIFVKERNISPQLDKTQLRIELTPYLIEVQRNSQILDEVAKEEGKKLADSINEKLNEDDNEEKN